MLNKNLSILKKLVDSSLVDNYVVKKDVLLFKPKMIEIDASGGLADNHRDANNYLKKSIHNFRHNSRKQIVNYNKRMGKGI